MAENTLVHLPGSVLTPTVVLHRTLQRIDDIEDIAIVYREKDGSLNATWSKMGTTSLAALAFVLSAQIQKVLTEDMD